MVQREEEENNESGLALYDRVTPFLLGSFTPARLNMGLLVPQ